MTLNDLSPDEQHTMRRFADCFMLTTGADTPIRDELIQPLMYTCCQHFKKQLSGIGFSKRDILAGDVSLYHHFLTRQHLTVMITLACHVLGQQPVRQIMTQALTDVGTLDDIGNTLWHSVRRRIKKGKSCGRH